MKKLIRFFKDEEGATAPEYGLIVALIAVGLIASVKIIGTSVSDTFSQTASELE